jgi:hypothetical protein
MASAEWHWEQGVKYAVETIKTSLLLNGAAAIALMTFATHQGSLSRGLIVALALFALGAVVSALTFGAAYMAQLRYGNGQRSKAEDWNEYAIWLALLSVGLFFVGISSAAFALWSTTSGAPSCGLYVG